MVRAMVRVRRDGDRVVGCVRERGESVIEPGRDKESESPVEGNT